ncbi:hypothetical protein [Myroides odoratimimus]|uniref:hypothetical protein n=1 Tax=Myroides odoratimimus TaxID=76832 RepID=UPI002DB635FE|nr:hypothetical protein [Myroides odoratimimus]MEC4083550.1 hypothetical protein [Myroides odoratimimus]
MKLISMIEFVLEQSIKRSVDNWPIETEDYFNRCEAYANFLKRPLNLGMFVPYDLECNVLKQPEKRFYLGNDFTTQLIISRDYEYDIQQYQQAQERVLFKGWFFDYDAYESGDNIVAKKLSEGVVIYLDLDESNYLIEDMLGMEEECLELTESAIKNFDYEVN